MPSYYEPQVDAFNLPLALIVFLATSHMQSSEIALDAKPEYYSPTSSLASNCSGNYYQAIDSQDDQLSDLSIIKRFAEKVISQTISLPDDAVAVLNKNFWDLV